MVEETALLLKETSDASKHGLSLLTTSIFLVGEMAGSGVLALPAAMSDTGVTGFVLIAACALAASYTGSILGKCWTIVLSRYEEHRDCPRYPYPAIGMVTFGKVARFLVSFCINASTFGSMVVYMLLASENIQDLSADINLSLPYCTWLYIIAAVLAPVTWLGTPKDFWPIAVAAAISTSVACCLIVINSAVDAGTVPEPSYNALEFNSFLTAFGTIFFAFGGHPTFPTFQADMKEPKKFGLACVFAYIILTCIYEPVAIAGYAVYGSATDDNVINTLSQGTLKIIAEILVTIHLFAACIIVMNPLCQEGEELLGIPRRFGLGRVLFRTLITGLALFVALSVPQFGNIMSLIGASALTALVMIFPPIFYLKLSAMSGEGDNLEIPVQEKAVLVVLVILGLFILVASTYSALLTITTDDFTMPCYL